MLVFIAIIILVAALFVVFALPKINPGKIALKTAAARDIALILNTIYVYPYDIEMQYDFDLSEFVIEVSQQKVRIYDPSFGVAKDPTAAEYPFVPVNDNPNFILDKPSKIIFKKEKGVLTVTI